MANPASKARGSGETAGKLRAAKGTVFDCDRQGYGERLQTVRCVRPPERGHWRHSALRACGLPAGFAQRHLCRFDCRAWKGKRECFPDGKSVQHVMRARQLSKIFAESRQFCFGRCSRRIASTIMVNPCSRSFAVRYAAFVPVQKLASNCAGPGSGCRRGWPVTLNKSAFDAMHGECALRD